MTFVPGSMEHEVIYLNAVQDLIDELVSAQLFDLLGSDPDRQVMFHSRIHLKFFNIVLNDFLSVTDKDHPAVRSTYLAALKSISQSPNFDVNGSISDLKQAVQEFSDWLLREMTEEIWLPSIKKTAALHMPRMKFIKMCGNISKHNSLRVLGVAKELRELLAMQSVSISLPESLLALDDFFECFHDILNYHGTTIVESLNNVQWGIRNYLTPEFRRSYMKDPNDLYRYWYVIPDQIQDDFAKSCYWNIMNNVRRTPNAPRFQGTTWSKLRY